MIDGVDVRVTQDPNMSVIERVIRWLRGETQVLVFPEGGPFELANQLADFAWTDGSAEHTALGTLAAMALKEGHETVVHQFQLGGDVLTSWKVTVEKVA